MRYLLIFFLLCSLHSGYAQCTKKKDDMTGRVSVDVPIKRLGTEPREGFFGTPLYLDATMSQSEDRLMLVLMPQFFSKITIHEGDQVYLKFDDDSVITLPVEVPDRSRRSIPSVFTQGEHAKIYSSTLMLTVAGQKLDQLRTKKVVKIRCSVYDYILKGKQQKLISEWIECIESTKY